MEITAISLYGDIQDLTSSTTQSFHLFEFTAELNNLKNQ